MTVNGNPVCVILDAHRAGYVPDIALPLSALHCFNSIQFHLSVHLAPLFILTTCAVLLLRCSELFAEKS